MVPPVPPKDLCLIGRYEGKCDGRFSKRPNHIGLLDSTEMADRPLKQ